MGKEGESASQLDRSKAKSGRSESDRPYRGYNQDSYCTSDDETKAKPWP